MSFRRAAGACLIQAMLVCTIAARAEDTGVALQDACVLPAKRMQRLELIFGGGGVKGPVSAKVWTAFLGREVSPRFPDGFSVFEGYGQWRNKAGTIEREPSRLLLIWYEHDATSDAKIEAIRDAYKKRFHQESVLRADEVSCISF